MQAIKKRYGGNKESKKVQRTLLKQEYENFLGSSSETIDQTFVRLQKLISQLEIQGEVITQEVMNLKLLRSLPSKWKTHALIWRNKEEIKTISLDDLYNNLKIYEPEHAGSSSTRQNLQNVAFVSSNNTNNNSSTNEADNTAYGVSRKLDVNSQRVGFDRTKVECYNCHKNGHFTRECRALRNQENRGIENNRRTVTMETPTKNDLVAQDGIGGYDWSYQVKEEHPTNFALMAHTSSRSSSSSDSEVKMDNPNITMEEYIRLEEEKSRRCCKVYNWETTTYGKTWDNEDVHDLGSIETEFPAIVFNDTLTSEAALSCEPMVKNDNDKVDMPLLPSPEPMVSNFDDLDYFKDFEKEFSAIIYNDAQTSKSDLLTEPILNPEHIDEFNLKDETSLSKCDEEEQNILNFNDLFPFNVIYPNDSKSDKDNELIEVKY
ncbi:ribonuclease H-like domain-containing protein [Tanacetum coccineum]